jgi:hypothetical protein
MLKINFILGKNTKSTNLQIHELVIFNQTTKIDTHEEKYPNITYTLNWNISSAEQATSISKKVLISCTPIYTGNYQ